MQTTHLQDYTPWGFDLTHCALDFTLDPNATTVRSTLAITPTGSQPQDLVLDGEDLELISLLCNGHPLQPQHYRLTAQNLTILQVSKPITLEITVRINPAANTRLEGLYISGGTYCTQCEAQGFRRITYYPDRPDVLTRFTVAITAPQAMPVVLSNGNCTTAHQNPDGSHTAVWHDPFPKPCYLFALIAGQLDCLEDTFHTRSGRSVTLRLYIQPAHNGSALTPRLACAMQSLKRAMRWDEQRFDLEYDLDVFHIVGIHAFNMGAMENKSLNIFNAACLLADHHSATDRDIAFVDSIIAHEYFHNWTGNRITCRDWFQLSLKEGLTVFRDQEYTADTCSRPVKRIEDVTRLRQSQFLEDAGPFAHPIRPQSYLAIDNFYTTTVYEKGAEVIRMLHRLLGEDRFMAGMQRYVQQNDGKAVRCEEFIQAMAEANDVDLQPFFRWYDVAGTPHVTVRTHWQDGELTVTLSQTFHPTPDQPHKPALVIPFSIGFVDEQGCDLIPSASTPVPWEHHEASHSALLVLERSEQTWVFSGLKHKPVLSLNRGFSAPVIVHNTDETPQALQHLMTCDSDPVARWEAGRRLITLSLLRMIQHHEDPDPACVAALAHIFQTPMDDAAWQAQLMLLPAHNELYGLIPNIDPLQVDRALRAFKTVLGQQQGLRELYGAIEAIETAPDDKSHAGVRQRGFIALRYLCSTPHQPEPELWHTIEDHHKRARTMTERLGTLAELVHHHTPERTQALDAFYHTWKDDDVVLDKWFQIQAMSHLSDPLERVRALTEHPDFSLSNPNRVRSVVSVFCAANIPGFHHSSGEGYRFLKDIALALDALNPQVAARILAPLNNWRLFDEARQSLMRDVLAEIQSHKALSTNVTEVVTKALA